MPPTPEQIEAARTLAIRKFADRPVPERVSRLVKLTDVGPDGRPLALLAVPFTFAGYAAHQDARAADVETAQASLYADRVVFPENALEIVRALPALTVKVSDKLHEIAGMRQGVGTSALLDPAVPLPGLTKEQAAALPHARPLWTLVHSKLGFVVVVEAPDADVYHAVRARAREAQEAGKGLVDSFIQPIRDAVRWSSEPLDVLFDRVPYAAKLIMDTWSAAGGADVDLKSEDV